MDPSDSQNVLLFPVIKALVKDRNRFEGRNSGGPIYTVTVKEVFKVKLVTWWWQTSCTIQLEKLHLLHICMNVLILKIIYGNNYLVFDAIFGIIIWYYWLVNIIV